MYLSDSGPYRNMPTKEIAEMMVQATVEYTDIYFKSLLGRDGKMDKQLWASLHMGIIIGMQQAGYTQDQMHEALHIAQGRLSEMYGNGLSVEKQ